jgi:hypothetical protein
VTLFLFELRRSPLKWASPVFAALAALAAFSMMISGVPMWGDLTAGYALSGLALGPIAGALAAWEAGRRGRVLAARAEFGVRSTFRVVATHFAAMVLWIVFGLAMGFLIVTLISAAIDSYGAPIWLWLLATVLGIVMCAAVGYFVGMRVGSRWFIGPLVGVLLFALRAVLSGAGLPYWIVQAYPTTLNSTNPFVNYIDATFIAQSAWYLGATLVLLILSVPGAARGWGTKSVIALPAAAIIVGGLTGLAATNGQVTHGDNHRDYVCQREPIDICVYTPYARGLPALEKAFGAFNARVAGTSLVATKLEHTADGIGANLSKGAQPLYLYDLGNHYAENAVREYEQTVGGLQLCTSGDTAAAHIVVDYWLTRQPLPEIGYPKDLVAQSGSFWTMSEKQRQEWLRDNQSKFTTCTLTVRDLA